MPYYNYGGYPGPGGYYAPPMPDQLAQLRSNPYQQPNLMMQNNPQIQQPANNAPTPVSSGINWCQGEEGAKAWLVAPGTTVMLMDSDGCSFYLKSADASGMPQPLRIFDYKERNAPKPVSEPGPSSGEYVTREEWNALAARADALSAELEALKNKPCTCNNEKEEDA